MNFFKSLLASCLGVILAIIVLFFVGSMIISGLVKSANKNEVSVKSNSVLNLNFKSSIPEKTDNVENESFTLNDDKTYGIRDIVKTLEIASTDDNIKGIFLDLTDVHMGKATASSIRQGLLDFKSKGKFITAYAEGYTQNAYYIASAANQIYVHPLGDVDFRGFATQIPFFKDMLDKLGVKMQVYYVGQFKGATEPYRLEKMSDQNRLQTREYLESLYQIYLSDIAKSRNTTVETLRNLANEYKIRKAEDALSYKLVDKIGYRDEVLSDLKSKLSLKDSEKINSINLSDYASDRLKEPDLSIKDKIALVYAEGEIVDGKGENGNIGGKKYADMLRDIRMDDKVKAIVLRVNSPGGSGLASENIWRELKLAKEGGKPVVVSMGDYAASGGYYISCGADSIFAQPNTITGSIGVFGIIPSVQKTLKDKAGISFDTVKTGKYAASFSPFFEINADEGKIIQESVDMFYDRFLKRVSDGRKMEREKVHEIAQGRVWTGSKAATIGLVDRIGTLDDAIVCAAKLSGVTKYRTSEYPKTKDKYQKIIDKLNGDDEDKDIMAKTLLKSQLGEYFPFIEEIRTIKNMKGPQARLPFVIQN